jgi:hypothetical protein
MVRVIGLMKNMTVITEPQNSLLTNLLLSNSSSDLNNAIGNLINLKTQFQSQEGLFLNTTNQSQSKVVSLINNLIWVLEKQKINTKTIKNKLTIFFLQCVVQLK